MKNISEAIRTTTKGGFETVSNKDGSLIVLAKDTDVLEKIAYTVSYLGYTADYVENSNFLIVKNQHDGMDTIPSRESITIIPLPLKDAVSLVSDDFVKIWNEDGTCTLCCKKCNSRTYISDASIMLSGHGIRVTYREGNNFFIASEVPVEAESAEAKNESNEGVA